MALQRLLQVLFCRLPFRPDFVLANRRSAIPLLTGAVSFPWDVVVLRLVAGRQRSTYPKEPDGSRSPLGEHSRTVKAGAYELGTIPDKAAI